MIELVLLLGIHVSPSGLDQPRQHIEVEDPKEEFKRRKKEAGENVDALWELYEWCEAYGLDKEGRTCLRAILKVDEEHTRAHELLGHVFYDGQWFTSDKKLEAYKKKEALRKAEEEGLVEYEGKWVSKDDLPYLERGMIRDESGEWVDAEEYRRKQEGWVKQDTTWISPEEQAKIAEGLWKCGDQWLSLEQADEYHSKLGQWWTIPTEDFLVHSTCTRTITKQAIEHMDRAYRDLKKVYGVTPKVQVPVVLLKSQGQYSQLAAGNEAGSSPAETHGLSSVHYAFFADALFVADGEAIDWIRAGVGYWDAAAENGELWGVHSARHAAGLSFAEAMDPSAEAVKEFRENGDVTQKLLGKFYAQKQVPEWFRIGAVSYGERYFVDNLVKAGGNPYWAREWSIQNILKKGGLDPVKLLLKGSLTSDDPDGSAKLMNEWGLLIAFIVDGGIEELQSAHSAVKEAFVAGEDPSKAIAALGKLLEKNEDGLRKFAGL